MLSWEHVYKEVLHSWQGLYYEVCHVRIYSLGNQGLLKALKPWLKLRNQYEDSYFMINEIFRKENQKATVKENKERRVMMDSKASDPIIFGDNGRIGRGIGFL